MASFDQRHQTIQGESTNQSQTVEREHHRKEQPCYNRAKYRQGRKDRAVKVYTVNMESKYLLVMNVPALGITKELLDQLSLYGDIEEYRILYDYPCEAFTEVYWVKYRDIDCSRAAKRKMDNCPFFSNLLHVCYAPEFENMDEVRDKLEQRRLTISRKLKQYVNNHKKTDSELIASSSHQSNVSSSPIATSVVHSEEFLTNHSYSSKPLFPPLPMPPVVMATSQMTSPFVSNNELHSRLPGNTHARLHSLADTVHSTTPSNTYGTAPSNPRGTMTSNTYGTTPSNTSGTTPNKRHGENFPDVTTENQKTSSIGLSLEVRKELHQSHITPKVRWEREGDLYGQQSSVKLVVSSVQKTDVCSEQKGKSRKRRDDDNFFNLHDQTRPSDGSSEGGMYAQKSNIQPHTGNTSVDRSVATIRRTMTEVMKPAVTATKSATSENAPQKSRRRAAKRRRI